MLLGQRVEQLAAAVKPPGILQVVAQLADQHRRRAFAVVANAPSDPADVQLLTGGEQGFEEQVAVVFAARAVARAVVTGHQVEVQAQGAARVVAVVHAEQADHPEGDGAHGHQRAEIHGAAEEALTELALFEQAQPGLADHGQRQRLVQLHRRGQLQPVFEGLAQLEQQALIVLVLGAEAVIQQLAEALPPGAGGLRLGQLLV